MGGFLADMVKHSHIDKAQEAISKAQKKLARFRSELADVKIMNNLSINISDFSKFADFFFDGLFADLNMQSKIKSSLESVENTKNQVSKVLTKLKTMKKQTVNRINLLEEEIDKLISNA
ncbi:MAG: hypothetical protein GX757_12905 [Clostridiales bacterium]|nr:hypothetical protein [Clostridiales bacterium]